MIAGVSQVVFSHYRKLPPNGNDSTLYQMELWRAWLPSPMAGSHVAILHFGGRRAGDRGIRGLHTFHRNRQHI